MRTLLLDTETTSLVANSLVRAEQQPRIIEFYGEVVEDDGAVVSSLGFLAHPGMPITEEITRITRITNADLAGKPPFSEHLPALCDLMGLADAVVAHNLSFDRACVDLEFTRLSKVCPWPARQLCTVEETEYIMGYRLSLSALHEHLFGETFHDAHRAENDVKALTRCYLKLRADGAI